MAPPEPDAVDGADWSFDPRVGALLALSRGAGNAAVARAVLARKDPPARAAPAATGPEADAKQLKDALFQSESFRDGRREDMLTLALRLGKRYTEIEAAYRKLSAPGLDEDVRRLAGSPTDAARILAYLKYGHLRVADKLYIALASGDEKTLFRLLPEAKASGGLAASDFATDYATAYPTDGKLLDGGNSRMPAPSRRTSHVPTGSRVWRCSHTGPSGPSTNCGWQ